MKLSIGALLGVIILTSACTAEETVPDKYGAMDVCHQFIEDRLKAPSTADYVDEQVVQRGKTWTVTGSVDSENSFGAKVRSTFICQVEPTDAEGSNWHLVNLALE